MLVVILGNAPVFADLRDTVASADLVVRMNRCDHLGGRIGTRTDILAITNTGPPVPDMFERRSPEFRRAFDQARWIMQPRSPLYNLMLAQADEAAAEVFVDHSDLIARQAAQAGKGLLCAGLIETRDLFRKLALLQAWPFRMPSTGACVAEYFLRRGAPTDRFIMSGFLHAGWDGHPWNAERSLFRSYKQHPSISVLE